MGILDLAGVALAALLSENFILVNCMGIGTRVRSFRDPVDALRTGYCLTVVMVLGALCSWLADFLVFTRFSWQYYRLLFLALLIPGLVAGLRKFIRVCVPELSRWWPSAATACPPPFSSPSWAALAPPWRWPALPVCGRRSTLTAAPDASGAPPSC